MAAASEAPATSKNTRRVIKKTVSMDASLATTEVARETVAPEIPAMIDVCPEGVTLTIQHVDASAWWKQASLRYSQAIGLAPLVLPQTPKRKRSGEDDVEEDADASKVGGRTDIAHPSRKQRGPATPCSAHPSGNASSNSEDAGDVGNDADTPIVSHPARSPSPKSAPRSSPRATRFSTSLQSCEICCNEVTAGEAIRLGCSHGWYCTTCMVHHAEARLGVGATSIPCPECRTAVPEHDLRKVVPPEVLDRLLAQSLEQAVSSVADLWSCPTPDCPMRVCLEEGDSPLLRCTVCKKNSCLRCGAQPFHRGLTCDQHSERMCKQGKRRHEEAHESFMKWIEKTGTKQCPTCRIAVTKENLDRQTTQYQECHKMLCRNCNTRFCFKCLAVLTDSFTCGCSIAAHGFVDPRTGKRLNHLRPGRGKAPTKQKAGR